MSCLCVSSLAVLPVTNPILLLTSLSTIPLLTYSSMFSNLTTQPCSWFKSPPRLFHNHNMVFIVARIPLEAAVTQQPKLLYCYNVSSPLVAQCTISSLDWIWFVSGPLSPNHWQCQSIASVAPIYTHPAPIVYCLFLPLIIIVMYVDWSSLCYFGRVDCHEISSMMYWQLLSDHPHFALCLCTQHITQRGIR